MFIYYVLILTKMQILFCLKFKARLTARLAEPFGQGRAGSKLKVKLLAAN